MQYKNNMNFMVMKNFQSNFCFQINKKSKLFIVTKRTYPQIAIWKAQVLSGTKQIAGKSIAFTINRAMPDFFFKKLSTEDQQYKIMLESWNKIVFDIDQSNWQILISNKNSNDVIGRLYEGLHAAERVQALIKLNKAINESVGMTPWKVVARTLDGGRSIMSSKYGGDYGKKKIDGVEIEENDPSTIQSLETSDNLANNIRLIEVKSSQIGDFSSSLVKALADKKFIVNNVETINYLKQAYGLNVSVESTSIVKEVAYYGMFPKYIPENLVRDALQTNDVDLKNKIFNLIYEIEKQKIQELVEKNVTSFTLTCFEPVESFTTKEIVDPKFWVKELSEESF